MTRCNIKSTQNIFHLKKAYFEVHCHTEDNDRTILEGRMNENSLQSKIVTKLKYVHANCPLWRENKTLIFDSYNK